METGLLSTSLTNAITHTHRESPVVAPPQAKTASPNQLLSGGGRYSIVTSSSLEMEGVDSGERGSGVGVSAK